MTLIISVGNSEYFVQCSDRRLSSNGKIVDDDANKSAILVTKNGRFAVGFSGLARSGSFDTQTWFTESLCSSASPSFDTKETIDRFTIAATSIFRSHPNIKTLNPVHKRLSIMFTGYLYHHEPPIGALALVSNFEDLDNKTALPEARDEFRAYFHLEPRPNPPRIKLFGRVGAQTGNLYSVDFNKAVDLAVDGRDAKFVEEKLVTYIRKVAAHPSTRNSIGNEIFSVVIPRDRSSAFSTNYYPLSAKPQIYFPNFICAINNKKNFACMDIAISDADQLGAPMSGPKLKPNQPCWCGSGVRYKECHGAKAGHDGFSIEFTSQ